MKKLPNILTAFRLILIPIFIYLFLYENNCHAASMVFLTAGVTDILDGYIARKYNAQSRFGMLFDPVADKLLHLTVSACIAISGLQVMWVVFWVLLGKEIVMTIGAAKLYMNRNVVVPAVWYGKIASLVLFVVMFVIIYTGTQIVTTTRYWLAIAAVAAILFSGTGYLINYLTSFKK